MLAPPADRLVYALKYGGWPELGSELAEHMSRVLRLDATFGNETEPEQSRPIVPVPTTPGRLRTRGYNQARVLAEEVAGQMGAPLLDVLVRDEGGDSQIGLLPGERRANVDDAFSLRDRADVQIQDREVILVDDVLTTGATASASAVALESAGARRVRLLTFARSLPEPE